MNPNPYDATVTTSVTPQPFRSVRGLLVGCVLFAMAAFPAVSAGLKLLNQELGLFPVPYGVYGIEINGVAVSNRTFALSALLAGSLLLSIAAGLAWRARRNYQHNARISKGVAVDDGGRMLPPTSDE